MRGPHSGTGRGGRTAFRAICGAKRGVLCGDLTSVGPASLSLCRPMLTCCACGDGVGEGRRVQRRRRGEDGRPELVPVSGAEPACRGCSSARPLGRAGVADVRQGGSREGVFLGGGLRLKGTLEQVSALLFHRLSCFHAPRSWMTHSTMTRGPSALAVSAPTSLDASLTRMMTRVRARPQCVCAASFVLSGLTMRIDATPHWQGVQAIMFSPQRVARI